MGAPSPAGVETVDIVTFWEAFWSLLRPKMQKVIKCATFHDFPDFRESQRILPKIAFPCEDVASAADRTSKRINIPLVYKLSIASGGGGAVLAQETEDRDIFMKTRNFHELLEIS